MVSPNRNREDRANKGDLNILAQTQGLQGMAPIMVDTQQHVTEHAPFSRDHNPDNHQVPTSPPPFDEKKLLAMQAQVIQGMIQPSTVTPHSVKLTKGPVKRQVAEAWNHQKNKRNVERQSWEWKDNIRILRDQECVDVVSIMVIYVSRKIA